MNAKARKIEQTMKSGHDFYSACIVCGLDWGDPELQRIRNRQIKRAEKAFVELKRLERLLAAG